MGLVIGIVLAILVAVCASLLWDALKHRPADAPADARTQSGQTIRAPGAIDAALESAAKYQRDSRYAEASAILATLAEQAPSDQRVRLAWAQACLGLKDYPKAYAQYQAAIALEPDAVSRSTGAPTKVGNARSAQLHAEAGSVAFLAQMPERAIEHYAMAQTAEPTNARHPLYLAMAQLKVAEMGTKDAADLESSAMASLVRATLLDPELGEAWGTLAELELKRNQNDLAAQHLETALRLQPEMAKWRYVQARVLNRQGKPEQAVGVLTSLKPAEQSSKPALKLLGESYGLLKQPARAAAAYDTAARNNPTDPELWYQAAVWHQRAGEIEQARKSAQIAVTLGSAEARELVTVLGEP